MYRLLKSLNNNVVLVKDEQGQQAVVMGLGIVHNKKKGDIIPDARIEKLFSLKNEESKETTLLAKEASGEDLELSFTIRQKNLLWSKWKS